MPDRGFRSVAAGGGGRGGGAAHCGSALRGGRCSDQQLRQENGHVLPELSEMYTVSFCLLKGGLGGCCQVSVSHGQFYLNVELGLLSSTCM